MKLTDIERFLVQMYHDAATVSLRGTNGQNPVDDLQYPGRRITTNCFVRAYFGYENMYAQHMSDIPYTWLSSDHTFKVSANIGFWHRGTWIKQYDSLFCVLNEKGQVIAWQLTKGTSFAKVKSLLINVNARVSSSARPILRYYIDNCCSWSNNLKEVFGENLEVKLDLFHAVQRITKKIPKRGKKGSTVKMIRRRMINDLTMVFRNPSDLGSYRTMNTPSAGKMFEQLDDFLSKWKDQTYCEEDILPDVAIQELESLRKRMQKECLSDIPPSCGSNRNEAMHKTLRKNISRQRIGVQLAIALLGISFFIWNEKRSRNSGGKVSVRSIQNYYSSFLDTGKTHTKEKFGISLLERQNILSQISNAEIHASDISDPFQDIFNDNTDKNDNDKSGDYDSDNDDESTVCDTFLTTASAILKTFSLKLHLVIDLSSKINGKPKAFAKDIHFMKSALLLLSNSKFTSNEAASNRVDSILKGYGLERLQTPKDGNCLFSSISFFIKQMLAINIDRNENCDVVSREHFQSMGLSTDQDLQEIAAHLRKLVVNEFLGCNMQEYSSFLISAEHMSYEETAKNFESNGFFDCELGNAVILALANILRVSIVVFTSLENYPVITIVPNNEPITNTPAYLAFEQIGAGHYDAVIESTRQTIPQDEESEELSGDNRHETLHHGTCLNTAASNPGCRCGQGGAKNKQNRLFCAEYKSGCKCFRSLKGCTAMCGCYNCANTYGIRSPSMQGLPGAEVQPRKRRKHGITLKLEETS